MPPLPIRPRRLRRNEAIRRLVREHAIAPGHALLETDPAAGLESHSRDHRFGGMWLPLPESTDAAIQAAAGARAALNETFLAVDTRTMEADAATTAAALHEAGADLLAVDGNDTAAVREALEAAGAVHALVAACASFPLDAPETVWNPVDGAADWAADGADFILIEPALSNLDRIRAACERLTVPVIARISPSERAMYEAAFANGWLDAGKIPAEIVVSMHRAGARVVVVPTEWRESFAGEAA